jgi:hypothetical protein
LRRVLLGVLAGMSLTACLGDPVGPRGVLVVQRIAGSDTALIGAPGRALPQPIQFRLLDGAGRAIPGATVHWSTVSGGGRIVQADAMTGEDGTFAAQWELGTRASDAQRISAEVIVGGHHAVAEVSAVAVPVEVAALSILAETTEVRLAVPGQVHALATDPFGNHFVPNDLRFSSLDSTLMVDSTGGVLAHRRGYARVVGMAAGHADTALVHTIQVVQSIMVDRDTLRFHSLGQGQILGITLQDDQGLPVADSFPVVAPSDLSVIAVQLNDPLVVESQANGVATLTLTVGTVSRSVVALVRQRTASLTFAASNVAFDALNDTARANLIVLDSLGVPVQSPRITYSSSDTSVVGIDTAGLLRARGNGSATVTAQSLSGVVASVPVVVSQQVARIVVARDTLTFDALHAVLPVSAVALDRLGSPVVGATLAYVSDSGSVAAASPTGQVEALANGMSRVVAVHGADSAAVVVRVQQRPVRVRVDTVRFDAVAQTQSINAVALDSLGSPVSGDLTSLSVSDTAVVEQVDSVTVRSRANGMTTAQVTVAGVAGQVIVAVKQVAVTLSAAVAFEKAIVTVPPGTLLPMQCKAYDRNGYQTPDDPFLVSTTAGTVGGTSCSDLRVQRSGFDTLLLQLDQALVKVPVVVAAGAIPDSPLGDIAVGDTLPGQPGYTWAPSARRNAQGELEVYYSVYASEPDSSGYTRSDLHRVVWLGGNQFHYDGIVIRHDDDICSPQGQGIENMVIMPRVDSSGWRMLYAAGSNVCYGWQVFSAVSSDGRSWTKEPGIRLSNGGTGPLWPPWPVGEGMSADRLPSGEWRVLAGTFEHKMPADSTRWQIAEWRSWDQLQWTYVGTAITTLDMPSGWQGSVYSPTIREVAPGLWRMLFTANDRSIPGGRDAIWSAVSTDRSHWQVEGELLGAPSSSLYYAAMVDDQVVFIRQDHGGPMQLSIAHVIMP